MVTRGCEREIALELGQHSVEGNYKGQLVQVSFQIYWCIYKLLGCEVTPNSMASSKNTKIPPTLTDDTDYKNWKDDLKIWSLFTDIPAEE